MQLKSIYANKIIIEDTAACMVQFINFFNILTSTKPLNILLPSFPA